MNITTLITTLDTSLKRELRTCGRYDYGNIISYNLQNGITVNGTSYNATTIYLLPKTAGATLAIRGNSITQIPISDITTISV